MPEQENHHMPDVSTEPQRQALDEMSRQLEEKLNDMVRQQHERARRFAATQHSLSPLPSAPEMESLPPSIREEADVPPPAETPPEPNGRKKRPLLMPFPTQPKKPQVFEHVPLWEKKTLPQQNLLNETKEKKKSEESGCGTIPTILLIIIIVLIIRSCS